ncbi:MAG: efflux RND transporter permease subunit, partial [Holophagales bacterium]|nr:efflux RND transporter permease subunit [Holophagales bacterium]
QLPAAVEVEVWADAAEYIEDRLGLLRSNAWQGLLIILVLLTLFLDPRLAIWVAMGIPISIAGTLALLGDRFLGHSLNDITTFGLILVLGILVDDAIVVGESIHEARRGAEDRVAAAIAGVNRVSTATVFGALTTIAAFFPLLLIDNDIARIFAGFSVVVIAAVCISLIESKLILPAHLAAIGRHDRDRRGRLAIAWERARNRIDGALGTVVRSYYEPALGFVIHHRYSALLLLTALAVLGLGLMTTGKIRMVFFPEVPGNTITASVTMDPLSPESLTRRNAGRPEAAAAEVSRRLVEEHDLSSLPIAKVMVAVSGRREVEAYGELTREAMDTLGTTVVLNAWRDEVGELEGADDFHFSGSFDTGGGFALQIIGRDEAMLAEAVASVSQRLSTIAGVHDVRSDLEGGQPEIRLRLEPEARHLGFTLADLAAQIGDGFGGLEVQRMQRENDEVKVYVRYQEDRRHSLHQVLTSKVVTPDGRWVRLRSVADLEPGSGAGTIFRRDGKRAVTIEATLDKRVTGAAKVLRTVRADLARVPERWPGLVVQRSGELEEMGEIRSGMKKALGFTLADLAAQIGDGFGGL